MFASRTHGTNSPLTPAFLTPAFLTPACIATLSLHLLGCSLPRSEYQRNPEPILRAYPLDRSDTQALFAPPPGKVLHGFAYSNEALTPVYVKDEFNAGLTAREIECAQALVAPAEATRAAALEALALQYLPRLEPLLLFCALQDPSERVSGAALSLIKPRAQERTIELLCREIHTARGEPLVRCVEILGAHPSDAVARALFSALRSSGYLEKEGRDDSMCLGKTLAGLNPLGEQLIAKLLNDRDPQMQLAGAVSAAVHRRTEALPILLRFADSADPSVRGEALSHLPYFPNHPEIIPPLERALADQTQSAGALRTLRELRARALPALLPYSDPSFFLASGIERYGTNPYHPGLSYGEIVEAICWCSTAEATTGAPPAPERDALLAAIASAGLHKMILDLDRPQLAPGAVAGLTALGSPVYPYIPELLAKEAARPLLLSYPTTVLVERCAAFLGSAEVTPRAVLSSALLSQRVRSGLEPAQRTRDLATIIETLPTSPWLRAIASQCWTEELDGGWITAALRQSSPTPSSRALQDEIARASQIGIKMPLRWSQTNLDEIICNRSACYFDGRPIATLIYTTTDPNGAFRQHDKMVTSLIANGYCVMYFDESTDLGVLRAMKQAVTRSHERTTKPAALLILAAHSSRTEMDFGRSDDDTAKIGLDDEGLFVQSAVTETLQQDSQIILIACSAGEGRDTRSNIANMFHLLFPQVKERGIWSSEVPDNLKELQFDPLTKVVREVRFFRQKIYTP